LIRDVWHVCVGSGGKWARERETERGGGKRDRERDRERERWRKLVLPSRNSSGAV